MKIRQCLIELGVYKFANRATSDEDTAVLD